MLLNRCPASGLSRPSQLPIGTWRHAPAVRATSAILLHRNSTGLLRRRCCPAAAVPPQNVQGSTEFAPASSADLTAPTYDDLQVRSAQPSYHNQAPQQVQVQVPPPQQLPDWLAPHQQVFHIFVSSFFAACTLAGGYFWVRWAILQLMASKQRSTPGQTLSGTAQGTSAASSTDDGLGPVASTTAVQDNLDDPFAPIRFLLGQVQASWPNRSRADNNQHDPHAATSTSTSSSSTSSPSTSSTSSAQVATPESPSQLARGSAVTGAAATSSSAAEARRNEGSGLHVYTALAQTAMDPTWRRTLSRCYYINCGTRLGILPRIPFQDGDTAGGADAASGQLSTSPPALHSTTGSTGGLDSGDVLVAFEGRSDAEFVAAVLRHTIDGGQSTAAGAAAAVAALMGNNASSTKAGVGLTGWGSGTSPGTGSNGSTQVLAPSLSSTATSVTSVAVKPQVIPSGVTVLEELVTLQGSRLAVLPADTLQPYFAMQMNTGELGRLLGDLLWGRGTKIPDLDYADLDVPRQQGGTGGDSQHGQQQGSGSTVSKGAGGVSAGHGSSGGGGGGGGGVGSGDGGKPGNGNNKDADQGGKGKKEGMSGDQNDLSDMELLPPTVVPTPAELARLAGVTPEDLDGHTSQSSPVTPDAFQFPGFDDPSPVPVAAQHPTSTSGSSSATQSGGSVESTAGLQASHPDAVIEPLPVAASVIAAPAPRSNEQQAPPSSSQQQQGSSSNSARTAGPTRGEGSDTTQAPNTTTSPASGGSETEPSNEPGTSSSSGSGSSSKPGGASRPRPARDDLLAEYEAFKQMFAASRSSSSWPPPPSALAEEEEQQKPGAPFWEDVVAQQGAPTSPNGKDTCQQGPVSPLQQGPQAQGAQDVSKPSASYDPLKGPDVGAVKQVLSASGPTDAALKNAFQLMGVPEDDEDGGDLLSEWYALQEAERLESYKREEEVLLSARAVAPSPASTSSSRAGVPPPVQGGSFFNNSSSSGGGGASTGAAASNGSNGSTSTAESSSGARVYQSNGVTPPSGRQPPVQQPQPQLADLQRQLQALEGQLGKLMAEAQQQGGSLSPVGTQEAQRVAAQMRSLQADVGAAMAAAAHTGQSASSTPSESSSQAQQQQQQRAWGSGWGPFPVVESSVGSVGNSSNSGSGSLSSSPMSSSPSAAQPGSSSLPKMMDLSNRSSGGGDDEDDESGRVEVVSMRAGRERPWKRERDPGERQATVKEAMRYVSGAMSPQGPLFGQGPQQEEEEEMDREGVIDRVTGIDWHQVGGSADGDGGLKPSPLTGQQQPKWWQQRFQVLYTPNVKYRDGGVGFLQLDVSLNPGVRDVRVVTFEDRHDCMHCLTVMKQWPEYEWHLLEMNALPTSGIESEIVRAWQGQVSSGASSASRPAGIVVFRRGKLPMRVGMTMEEFTQVVVFQAAAQVSLSKVGYGFDDF